MPPVAPEPHRLELDHIDGFRMVALDPESGHHYALDVRRQGELGLTFTRRWADVLVDVEGCPDCWSPDEAEEAIRNYLAPRFAHGKHGATWLHLPVLTGDQLCPGCTTEDHIEIGARRLGRNGRKGATAHAG